MGWGGLAICRRMRRLFAFAKVCNKKRAQKSQLDQPAEMLTPGFVCGTKSACRNHLRGEGENGEIMKVAEKTWGALLRDEQVTGEAPELHVACFLH